VYSSRAPGTVRQSSVGEGVGVGVGEAIGEGDSVGEGDISGPKVVVVVAAAGGKSVMVGDIVVTGMQADMPTRRTTMEKRTMRNGWEVA
jgi:hypothetical protein